MTNKTYYFLAGLPRSGSTLLSNLLYQNPRFHTTPTSSLVRYVEGLKFSWHKWAETKANRSTFGSYAAMNRVIRAGMDAFHDTDRPVVIDKSRGWPKHIEQLEYVLDAQVKVIACVRPFAQVVASVEKLYREAKAHSVIADEEAHMEEYATLETRAAWWGKRQNFIGHAKVVLEEALKRGLASRIHLIEFEDLTRDPENEMRRIYRFLGEDSFDHDFDHVEQVHHEDDLIGHGWPDLHTIRPRVAPVRDDSAEVLGKTLADQLNSQNFWRTQPNNNGTTRKHHP